MEVKDTLDLRCFPVVVKTDCKKYLPGISVKTESCCTVNIKLPENIRKLRKFIFWKFGNKQVPY